jgi:glucose-induced degradation protein 4
MPTRPDEILQRPEEQLLIAANNRSVCPPSGSEEPRPPLRRVDSSQTPRDRISAPAMQDAPAVKLVEGEMDGPARDTPSPISATTEDANDGEQRPAQIVPSAAIDGDPTTLYDYYTELFASPSPRTRFAPNSMSSFLKPGSKFDGTQQSDRQVYDVQVEIKHVDMTESFLCGYLRIRGLTDDHPTLTTYFEGEIIGTKYTFQTKHAEWGSNEKVDMAHWARFPAWRPLSKQAKRPDFSYKNFAQRENIFMRWKEYFLVPDHRVRTISGASFEGFYYICFNQVTGSISGIYFHAKSEK